MFPEDGDVGDGGGEEEGAVAADRNHLGRVEAHVARQLWIEWREKWRGVTGEKEMRLGKLFIEPSRANLHAFTSRFFVLMKRGKWGFHIYKLVKKTGFNTTLTNGEEVIYHS